MLDMLLAAVGALAVVVGAFSSRLRSTAFTPPVLALGLGVLLGPRALGVVVVPDPEQIAILRTATELLLAIALMAVALRYRLEDARAQLGGVGLLLLLVMPLMAASMTGAALVLLGMPVAVALGLGAALAPTDPVLAAGVVAGGPAERSVPARLRQLLSLESGANDGLALPFVVAALAVAGGSGYLGGFLAGSLEVLIGVAVGIPIGLAAGWLLRTAEQHDDIEHGPRLLYTLVLALTVLGVIELVRGNGLLGVFVAGLAFSATATDRDRPVEASIDEGMNSFLVLPVFALFGAVLPWSGWLALGWGGVGFVLVALFVRRPPWVLLLARPLRLPVRDAVWLGWFGPMGVAPLFYLTHLHHQGMTTPALWHAGTLVVAVSTVVHGVTAGVGRRLASTPAGADGSGRTAGPGSV